jgi:probable HAF family extracellular repeat protein
MRECGKRVVERDDGMIRPGGHDGGLVEIHPYGSGSALLGGAGPGGVHQNAPHHLRGHGEKLSALLPFDFGHIDQAQVNFVDQRRGLKGVSLTLILHVAASHETQFVVHVLRQLVECGLIAAAPGFEQIGDVRVQNRIMTAVAGLLSGFRLKQRQDLNLQGANMKTLMTLIAAAGLLATAGLAQPSHPSYSVSDLGIVGPQGQPYFITNNGLIGGTAVTANNKTHATVWFMGFEVDLGTPGMGGPNSAAYAINAQGQAVGAAQTTLGNGEDFCGFNASGLAPSSTSCLPFVWQDGAMTKLPTVGGLNGAAIKINDLGEVAGYAETASHDPNPACQVLQFVPVVWGANGATQLKTPTGDPDGVAWGINDHGQVVGASGSCTTFNLNSGVFLLEKHALLWQNGTVVDLGNLGGTGAFAGHHACALNNRGQVVGHSDLTGDMAFHGFFWTWETGMRDMGTLPGDAFSLGLGISGNGVTVGASLDKTFNPRAIVFEDGAMTDLNSVLSSNPQKLYLLFAESINSTGQIVGLAAAANGNLHGFLASPDTVGNYLAAFQNATSPAPLSDIARKTVFRRLGIPGR